jgi:hypothetical protein
MNANARSRGSSEPRRYDRAVGARAKEFPKNMVERLGGQA